MEGTSKNRIISPGKVLHFYNSPPDSTSESLSEVFGKVGVSPPIGVKFFSQGDVEFGKTSRVTNQDCNLLLL